MSDSGYTISLYRSESIHEVVELLKYLWGDDHDKNLEYFRWKYDENPYVKMPLAVTALFNSRIVGFRGYFAAKWHIPGKNKEIIVLNPGDTVVHPGHRMRGLSLKMGHLAMDLFASEYNIFFNHSASAKSTPGYLKMGFMPLLNKSVLSRYSLAGLARFLIMARFNLKADKRKVVYAEFGKIIVSDSPNPKAMSAVISSQAKHEGRITLLQDELFFNWRYRNTKNRYVFYYYQNEFKTAAYIVIRQSQNGRRGYICDYGAAEYQYMEDILKFIIRKKHFDVISMYRLNLCSELYGILAKKGFSDKGLLRRIEKKIIGEWPLLVRPVKRSMAETDWLVEGLDIRRSEIWEIKEISSDSS
jgi:hypothetical protein